MLYKLTLLNTCLLLAYMGPVSVV